MPGFSGPVTASGGLDEVTGGYTVQASLAGPGGSNAAVSGLLAEDFGQADLAVSGGAEAALVNSFIAPRSLQGPVRFDLALKGAPSLAALSGSVTLSDARIVAPTLGYALEGADLSAQLSGGLWSRGGRRWLAAVRFHCRGRSA